jgi:mannose-1-phosphate guanylyltransferase
LNLVIFAGGTGRRLWPISRQHSPKQFEPIIGSRSTVQLAVDRVLEAYRAEDIFISSGDRYLEILRRQIPAVPDTHFIGEPVRRDLAAAVGLAMVHVVERGDPDTPVAILWGDSTMTDSAAFHHLLRVAEAIIKQGAAEIVFIGETPRFANNNLGWIGLEEQKGEVDGRPYYGLKSWTYRPPLDQCQHMFRSGSHVWNTGYFVTWPRYILDLYRQYQPEMYAGLTRIAAAIGGDNYQAVLQAVYPDFESIHFDDAIARNVRLDEAVVLHGVTGWSDPGTLYALKETINPDPAANVTKGLVKDHKTVDSLLYNYEPGKLMAVVGLEGIIVVNTEDAILVVHKDDIGLVKELVDGLVGTELEKYS